MKQCIIDPRKSIRLPATGSHDTYAVIWQDGTMIYRLKDQYPGLEPALESVQAEDITVSRLKSSL